MGREKRSENRGEHFTKMVRSTMETPAWRALRPISQALYPWLKLEWRGPKNNNNGNIRLSVRQAAEMLGVGINTAARAFHDLQAKGFIVVTKPACLGVAGQATSPTYELTEIALPYSERHDGRRLFKCWSKGADYPVQKAAVHNPNGHPRKRTPVIKLATARH